MPQDLQETLQNWRGKGRDLLEFVAVFPGIGYNTPKWRRPEAGPGAENPLLTCHLFWHIIRRFYPWAGFPSEPPTGQPI